MKTGTLEGLFADELREIYNAEHQLLEILPELSKAATLADLRRAFERQVEETHLQIAYIQQICNQLDIDAKGRKSTGMEGLIEESKAVIKSGMDSDLLNVALIAVTQRIYHYAIAAYGAARAHARQLGLISIANLLNLALDEKKQADQRLTDLAETRINVQAAMIQSNAAEASAPTKKENKMTNLIQNWWLVALRGVVAILFGLMAFFWPGATLFALVVLFGFYALADGLIAIAAGLSHKNDSPRWWVFLIEGLVGIAVGVSTLIWPGVTTLVILAMIATWAILTGILEIAAAIRLRRAITNEWTLALSGILSVVLGIIFILQPLAGTVVIVWTIGAYALLFGALWVLLGFRLRDVGRMFKPRQVYMFRRKGGSHVSRPS
jgi:uncharacterized membrane protein HdeD (DUF308 family)/ferritin-like metal-binding protein YciE